MDAKRRYCVLSKSAKRMRSVLYRAGCHGCKAKILCAEQIRSPLWEEIRSVPEGYSFLLKKWYNILKTHTTMTHSFSLVTALLLASVVTISIAGTML